MTRLGRIRPGLAIALTLVAGGGLFLACGAALDPEAPEACDEERCDASVFPEGSSSVDGGTSEDAGSSVDASGTAKDGSTAASDASDAADSGWDAPPLLPCEDGGLPGALDPTFGDGGFAYFNAAPGFISQGFAVVVQPDGKTVLGGQTRVIRLTATGNLDTAFGDAGIVATSFATVGALDVSAVALEQDGRIVVAGQARLAGGGTDFAVARYTPGGALDGAFGGAGVALAGFAPSEDGFVGDVAVDPDGRVLVAGRRGNNLLPPADHAVARFNASGSLDTTFGAGGRVKFDVRSTDDLAREMLVQSDGKIVLVGSSQRPGLAGGFDTAVSRLNADGSLDPSFGAAGKVVIALSKWSTAGAVAVDGAGRIVLAGEARAPGTPGSPSDFAIFRLTPTGTLDGTFGSGGAVITDFGNDDRVTAGGLHVQPDGKYLAAGRSDTLPTMPLAFARLLADGAPDPGFGVAGKVVALASPQFRAHAATFSSGRTTFVGDWYPMPGTWMGAVRYCR